MNNINKEELERLYFKEGLSFKEISKKLNTTSVQYYFKKFGIKGRSYSESKRLEIGRKIPDFSKIKRGNWKALAWVLDCEGSIGFQSYKALIPSISIGMSSKKFVENIDKEFPELFNRCITRRVKWKDYEWVMYDLRTNSNEYVFNTLKRVIPHLTTKKNIAILLKLFCERRNKWRRGNFDNKQKELDRDLADFIRRMNMKKQTDEQKEKIFKEAQKFIEVNKL